MRDYPHYGADRDYTTNAPSYYDDLARKNELMKHLAKKVWEYDKTLFESLEEFRHIIGDGFNEEIQRLFVQWVDDGTLDHLINITLLGTKTTNIDHSLTIPVGESQKFKTINEALKHLSRFQATYNQGDDQVQILLDRGFVVKEQILVDSLDLSWITISSQDNTTKISRESLTKVFGAENKTPFLGGKNGAYLPVIDVHFTMDDSGTKNTGCDGLYLERGSKAVIQSGGGIRSAGGFGIRAWDGSTVMARETDFSHANERGAMISQGSRLIAPQIDLSHAKGRNTLRVYNNSFANVEGGNLSYGGETNVRISEGSMVDMQGANVSNAGTVDSEKSSIGVYVFGASTVYADNSNFSNCKDDGIRVSSNGVISAQNSIITNCKGMGVNVYGGGRALVGGSTIFDTIGFALRASNGGTIIAYDCDCKRSGVEAGVRAEFGGTVIGDNIDSSNNKVGFQATRGGSIRGRFLRADHCEVGYSVLWDSEIVAREASGQYCTDKAVLCSTGSTFKSSQGNFEGALNIGLHCYRGSQALVYGSRFMKGNVESPTDIVCTAGSIVSAYDTTGGFNKAINFVNGDGVIFKNDGTGVE